VHNPQFVDPSPRPDSICLETDHEDSLPVYALRGAESWLVPTNVMFLGLLVENPGVYMCRTFPPSHPRAEGPLGMALPVSPPRRALACDSMH